jgi:hypothetical protein
MPPESDRIDAMIPADSKALFAITASIFAASIELNLPLSWFHSSYVNQAVRA